MTTGFKAFLLCVNLSALGICLLNYTDNHDLLQAIGLGFIIYSFWALVYTMFWYIDRVAGG